MDKLLRVLRRFIVLDIIVVLLLCGVIAYVVLKNTTVIKSQNLSSSSSTPVPVSTKVWQITFNFNSQTQQLTMKDIVIKKGIADASPDTTSPYTLFVLDKNKKILFQTSIVIAQQILYDVYFSPGSTSSALPQLENLESLVTIPYFDNAQTITVSRNNNAILSFTPTKQISLALPPLVQQAYAASCSLLHIVFVSDGYTDMNVFHADVQKAEETFLSKAPFSSHADIFDFKTVDNPVTNPLGCKQNNNLQVECLYNSNLSKISNLVFSTYPQLPQTSVYTKIVVLVDGAPEPVNGGYVLGVANALGGQFGVFQDQLFFEATATMEVLGHDVGQLYDRYIYPSVPGSASDIGKTIPPPFLSNCTTNPQGESFWANAGVSTAYKGCTSQYLYAPAPLDCPDGRGSSSTVMSAAGCAGGQFDGVEQYYLSSVILPRYCGLAPTSTPTIPITAKTIKISPVITTVVSNPTSSTVTTYNCQLDPSCSTNSNLQLCQLKCTAQ